MDDIIVVDDSSDEEERGRNKTSSSAAAVPTTTTKPVARTAPPTVMGKVEEEDQGQGALEAVRKIRRKSSIQESKQSEGGTQKRRRVQKRSMIQESKQSDCSEISSLKSAAVLPKSPGNTLRSTIVGGKHHHTKRITPDAVAQATTANTKTNAASPPQKKKKKSTTTNMHASSSPSTQLLSKLQTTPPTKKRKHDERRSPPHPVAVARCCWMCAVSLHPTNKGDICWYAVNSHAVLDVPVCAVCAEKAADVVPDDTCWGCRTDKATTLLLCDACDKEFCLECVKKCNGRDMGYLQEEEEPWECPACAPPTFLTRIRDMMESDKQVEQPQEELVQLLYNAEVEKKMCEKYLEKDDASIRQEIEDELESTETGLEAYIAEEVKSRRQEWEDHHTRLSDFVSRLQDELQTNHNIELLDLYNNINKDPLFQDDTAEIDHSAVDAEIAKRERAWYKPEDTSIYEKCIEHLSSSNTEDLGAVNETYDQGLIERGWRAEQEQARPTARQIAMALQNELDKDIVPSTIEDDKDQIMQVRENENVQNEVKIYVKKNSPRGEKSDPVHQGTSAFAASPSRSPPKGKSTGAIIPSAKTEQKAKALNQPLNLGASFAEQNPAELPFCVHPELTKHLKEHQAAGIKFMWKNLFADFGQEQQGEEASVGGCILAHAMGLGKSFSTICLIHTAMHHATAKRVVRRVLLVVPVNTVQNWEDEFRKWLAGVAQNSITVRNLSDCVLAARTKLIGDWERDGGVLIATANLFRKLNFNADLVVVDEAHTLLKKGNSTMTKALMGISTKRRLALTGSPFQNNLMEYYHLLKFVRPELKELLTEHQFEETFVKPINRGMLSDSSLDDTQQCFVKAGELSSIVKKYLDRVDASILRRDLGELHNIVCHVRQTKLQTKLYRLYKAKAKESAELSGFFKMFQSLRPVHCHPSALLYSSPRDSAANTKETPIEEKWWHEIKETDVGMQDIHHGNKILLLLHIIAMSSQIGDKVLVYANSLRTLDCIEHILSLEDWGGHVPSLKKAFPSSVLGGWKASKEFLRIDGSMNAQERGDSVDRFNNNEQVKVFLYSQAGGIGINLVKANRVVLMDNHFNPTHASQAVARSYRYGQEKTVYCYQLLTQGSIEESIFSRGVNKAGLALLMLDEKAIDRNYSAEELSFSTLQWVQCDHCNKWRCLFNKDGLPEEDTSSLPDEWFCQLNNDQINNTCEKSEKDQHWYEKRVSAKMAAVSNGNPMLFDASTPRTQEPATSQVNDPILNHIIGLTSHEKNTPLISKNYMHDTLLATTDALTALQELEIQAKDEKEKAIEQQAQDALRKAQEQEALRQQQENSELQRSPVDSAVTVNRAENTTVLPVPNIADNVVNTTRKPAALPAEAVRKKPPPPPTKEAKKEVGVTPNAAKTMRKPAALPAGAVRKKPPPCPTKQAKTVGVTPKVPAVQKCRGVSPDGTNPLVLAERSAAIPNLSPAPVVSAHSADSVTLASTIAASMNGDEVCIDLCSSSDEE